MAIGWTLHFAPKGACVNLGRFYLQTFDPYRGRGPRRAELKAVEKVSNEKGEGRNPKDRRPNPEARIDTAAFPISTFGLLSAFGPSAFGFRVRHTFATGFS